VDQAREWLKSAKHIAILTGAGISAESGIPTFRGAGGLWRNFRAEDLATPAAFARDPKLVWEWYDWRRGLIAKAQPNPGHHAIAQLEQRTPKFTLITQNVDGLHRQAGSHNILEIHGSIWTLRCVQCGKQQEDRTVPLNELPPKCACGGIQRPGVVWFGEGLDPEVWHNAEEAAISAEVLLVAGTSAVVYPAASLAPLAKQSGARVIEINLDETPISGVVDCSLRGASGEILPQLIA
jgi:NAD-dependent deacetylase